MIKSGSRSPLKKEILMDITEHVEAENEITKLHSRRDDDSGIK